jgi:hypothetical protein
VPTADRPPARGATSSVPHGVITVVTNSVTSRRTFLVGLLGAGGTLSAAALAGCDPLGRGGPPPPPSDLAAFLQSTGALADRYDATLAVHGGLSATVGPIRDAHRAHAAALARLLFVKTPEVGTGPTPPDLEPAALDALTHAERTGHTAAVAVCLPAAQQYVALLGSIAAARASHLEALR